MLKYLYKNTKERKKVMDNEKMACCFSGHRRLPWESMEKIQKELSMVIDEYIKKGYYEFISGGALGFDLLAARMIVEKRRSDKRIRLIMILPCRDQHVRWSWRDIKEYEDILALADEVRYVCESYCTGCMHLRNKVMVDNSRVLIAYHTDSRGGTAYTVSYAKEKKREIINVAYRL